MPAPLVLPAADERLVAAFVAAQQAAGLRAWRSVVQAARTCCGRVARTDGREEGWARLGLDASGRGSTV